MADSLDYVDRRLQEVSARLAMRGGRAPPTDVSKPETWKRSTDKEGRPFAGVVITLCGRCTIVSDRRKDGTPIFLSFRRYGPPERDKWSPPTVISAKYSMQEARDACAEFIATEKPGEAAR